MSESPDTQAEAATVHMRGDSVWTVCGQDRANVRRWAVAEVAA